MANLNPYLEVYYAYYRYAHELYVQLEALIINYMVVLIIVMAILIILSMIQLVSHARQSLTPRQLQTLIQQLPMKLFYLLALQLTKAF